MTQHFVVYSDFNCPFCYALNERLGAGGNGEGAAWRGVQHAPHLPVPVASWRNDMAEDLEFEVQSVQRLAPELPIMVPAGKPNTARAIRATALAYSLDPQRASSFKDLLYRALWCEGADLSDSATLVDLAARVGFGPLAFSALDGRQISAVVARWQQDWEQTRVGAVPALIRSDGKQLVGLVGEGRLRAFLKPDNPVHHG